MYLHIWDQLLFLFLVETLPLNCLRTFTSFIDTSMLFSELLQLPILPASRKMAVVGGKPHIVSLEKL